MIFIEWLSLQLMGYARLNVLISHALVLHPLLSESSLGNELESMKVYHMTYYCLELIFEPHECIKLVES